MALVLMCNLDTSSVHTSEALNSWRWVRHPVFNQSTNRNSKERGKTRGTNKEIQATDPPGEVFPAFVWETNWSVEISWQERPLWLELLYDREAIAKAKDE